MYWSWISGSIYIKIFQAAQRRSELQKALESNSRVNVVQLERIRHLTTLNEDLKTSMQEMTRKNSASMAELEHELQLLKEEHKALEEKYELVRKMSSWTISKYFVTISYS